MGILGTLHNELKKEFPKKHQDKSKKQVSFNISNKMIDNKKFEDIKEANMDIADELIMEEYFDFRTFEYDQEETEEELTAHVTNLVSLVMSGPNAVVSKTLS
ncbi:29764_t:CDS:2 [Gigaspora margarita]|uniref:29764_t:CDS:1 n=1 Tax=Gigaspora margarita TaxID=4874 RepID=A0ABN7VZX3_GIGMA|nr:29764_t:CDS:2 [Gigaspora margarita]